jgi:hypothetical protein
MSNRRRFRMPRRSSCASRNPPHGRQRCQLSQSAIRPPMPRCPREFMPGAEQLIQWLRALCNLLFNGQVSLIRAFQRTSAAPRTSVAGRDHAKPARYPSCRQAGEEVHTGLRIERDDLRALGLGFAQVALQALQHASVDNRSVVRK